MSIQMGETVKAGSESAPLLAASLDEQLSSAIVGSPDPLRATRYIGEFHSKHSALLGRIATYPHGVAGLAVLSALSRFLSDESLRHPEWLDCLGDLERMIDTTEYAQRLELFLKDRRDEPALSLALFRRKELLRIAVRDGLRLAGVADLTAELSSVADAILGRALAIVNRPLQDDHGLPQSHGGTPSPFAVLSLGKLGGKELNYSSDIDLMFLYGENGETSGPRCISNKEFFKKVANQLTGLLSTYTASGICYRVDLRLRPEGSLGEVALSLEGAKEYYAKRARDWELQMLIKARVSAGDVALGHELLEFVEPAIYSTTLDFSTIETMSATRDRITEKLARRKLRESQFDVKLARGGIRDIEFLVQCLQRLHGARDVSVRHGGTLFALARFLEGGLLSESEHSRLAGAYEFLRNLEHRLQLEDDRQTHVLPNDPIDLERLARRMPGCGELSVRLASSEQLLQALNRHIENVQVIYDRIVHAQRPLFSGGLSLPAPPSYTRYNAEMEQPPALQQVLTERPAATTGQAFTQFLESLKDEPYYAHLLANHTVTADFTAQILELSPYLAEQLRTSPELLDQVQYVADHPGIRPAYEPLAGRLNDIEALRRFFRRQMMRILTGSICLPESVFPTLDRTSSVAEYTIARAYRIALEKELGSGRRDRKAGASFTEPANQMTVIALGRLGMREFDLGSDADLVFIIPDSELERQQFWTRVAEDMIDILTSYQGGGPILTLDTRLRPNGREGLLVQSESSYTDYFARKAEAWEGIAYMKARGVAGDLDRATSFLTELQQLDWRRYGQSGRSRHDLRQMRMRLQRELGSTAPLKAGEGGYYDADFILMYLRLKGAGLFFKSLNTPERIDIVEKMGHLERADAEFLQEATTYLRAVDHGLRIVTGRASERLPQAGPDRDRVASLLRRWTNTNTTAESLDEELAKLRERMRRLFDSVFY